MAVNHEIFQYIRRHEKLWFWSFYTRVPIRLLVIHRDWSTDLKRFAKRTKFPITYPCRRMWIRQTLGKAFYAVNSVSGIKQCRILIRKTTQKHIIFSHVRRISRGEFYRRVHLCVYFALFSPFDFRGRFYRSFYLFFIAESFSLYIGFFSIRAVGKIAENYRSKSSKK